MKEKLNSLIMEVGNKLGNELEGKNIVDALEYQNIFFSKLIVSSVGALLNNLPLDRKIEFINLINRTSIDIMNFIDEQGVFNAKV